MAFYRPVFHLRPACSTQYVHAESYIERILHIIEHTIYDFTEEVQLFNVASSFNRTGE